MTTIYKYKGRDSKGVSITGELDGISADAVAKQLARRGITPTAIAPASSSLASKEIPLPDWLRNDRVKVEDLIMFSRQMYTITKAGIPLVISIRGLADTVHNRLLKEALHDIVERLETGAGLSAAMSQHPRVFNDLIINLVRVGEDSGRVDEAFLQLSEYLERDQETARRVKTALRYPSFVLIALTIAITVVNILVIPEFAGLFAQFSAQLPLPTRILVGISDFFVTFWPYLLVALVGIILYTRHYLKTEQGALRWGQKKLKLPIVGDIINRATLSRYARTFSMMLRSGVPLPQALELCARALENPWLAKKIRDIRASIERGENLYSTHLASGMFTPLVLQMISVGESSGQVDTLLGEVAEYYEREVEYDLKTLSDRLETDHYRDNGGVSCWCWRWVSSCPCGTCSISREADGGAANRLFTD